MRERAARIRDVLTIAARPGGGTDIAVAVPAAMVYQARARAKRRGGGDERVQIGA